VLQAARWKCRTQKIAKISPSGHRRTTLSDYILRKYRALSTIEKKLLNSNVSPTCPHNMVNFDPLAVEICWRVLRHDSEFQRVTHGTRVVDVSRNLRVEQRAQPTFGRAAITLVIGPHPSYYYSVPELGLNATIKSPYVCNALDIHNNINTTIN